VIRRRLKRAQTDWQRQRAAQDFVGWVKEPDLLAPAGRNRQKRFRLGFARFPVI
jgi:hypothetical protein